LPDAAVHRGVASDHRMRSVQNRIQASFLARL
jgi:hypothetical protein